MTTSTITKDGFRVDTGSGGKRRLIRCKGQTSEKRQCWQLTNDELSSLYLELQSYFKGPLQKDPSELANLEDVEDLFDLHQLAKEAYEKYGSASISFKVSLTP